MRVISVLIKTEIKKKSNEMNSQDVLCAVEVELCKKHGFLMLKKIIIL